MKEKYFKNIIVGAGAAGLYCACLIGGDTLVIEKKRRAGIKLLMSGSGQCNITHGGSIKDFAGHYGEHGKYVRGILQKHSNIKLSRFIEGLGVPLTEREDGKIFPASMKSGDVLEALLRELYSKGVKIKYGDAVQGLRYRSAGAEAPASDTGTAPQDTEVTPRDTGTGRREKGRFAVETEEGIIRCDNLVIATGGCSYPSTGSDGKMFGILKRDLSVAITEPKPSLTPVYVENYGYGDLSGISFKDVSMEISADASEDAGGAQSGRRLKLAFRGDLIFTHKNLSGPLILNSSRYLKPGAKLTLNFLSPLGRPQAVARFKRDFPGNGKSPQGYMTEDLGLSRRFAQKIAAELGISSNKVSRLSGSQIEALAEKLTAADFTVSGLAGFSEAMATCGGVSLTELDTASMSSKRYDGLYFIGEAADIDGDTGGYNLQFAFSSACAAAEDILKK